MQQLWRDAEQILTAAESGQRGANVSHLICVTPSGGIRILECPEPCSLAALAADCGAERLYRVERRNGAVRVEGWSRSGSIVVSTAFTSIKLSPPPFYATREMLGV